MSRYLADIFTCTDLGQHPEINTVLGHRVGDGQPLEDIIDVKEEPFNSTHLHTDPAKCEEVKATIPLNDMPVELEREPDISGAINKQFENGENISITQKQTFACQHCLYKATQKFHLQRHIRTIHEGQTFPCPHCKYKATQKCSLQTHIKSVHEGQTFQCPHCEYKAKKKENLQRHIKSVHEGQTFQCPHCEYKATRKSNLQTHINSVHEG